MKKEVKKTKKIKRLRKHYIVSVTNPNAVFGFKSIKSTLGFIEDILRLHPYSDIMITLE